MCRFLTVPKKVLCERERRILYILQSTFTGAAYSELPAVLRQQAQPAHGGIRAAVAGRGGIMFDGMFDGAAGQ
jgi:hypothetical protein